MNQTDRDNERLRQSGFVYHERQLDNKRWVGPPDRAIDAAGLEKRLPLTHVTPKPNMEIHAHEEIYRLPPDFKGDWFMVESPTGIKLIQ